MISRTALLYARVAAEEEVQRLALHRRSALLAVHLRSGAERSPHVENVANEFPGVCHLC
jgi:hypothetical protein